MEKELILKTGQVAKTDHKGATIALYYGDVPEVTLEELKQLVKQVESNQREGLISGELVQAVKYEFETVETLFLTLEASAELGHTQGVYKEYGIDDEEFKSVTHFIAESSFINGLKEWEG